jgi:hypothetical protein
MSGARTKINWVHAIGQSDLPTATKAVAYAIAAHMNGHGEGYPSEERIGKYASVSERTVRRHLQVLEPVYLTVERRRGFPNRYIAASFTPDTTMTGVSKRTPVSEGPNPGHSSDQDLGHSSDRLNGFEIERNGVSKETMTTLTLPKFVRAQLEKDAA